MPEYKYIEFILIDTKPKTQVWQCNNRRSNSELGIVKWHGPWRQYCYFPTVQAVYSTGCLTDIQDFIQKLMERHAR